MNSIRAWFTTRTGRLVVHDGAIAVGVGVAYLQTTHQPIDRAALLAAGVVAAKAFLRLILPVPGAGHADLQAVRQGLQQVHQGLQHLPQATAVELSSNLLWQFANVGPDAVPTSERLLYPNRLDLLPPPTGRKGGALPSPRDDRDYQAKLPTSIPASIDNGAGLTFGMLLNDRIGDCYPAALLHALQILSGGAYAPTDADVLHVYEQVTGYDPTRTGANGNNPTDNGTVGRVLFAWAKTHGLITSYAAVPIDRQSIRAAIAAHKAVLCEWALPVGAEREGDVWTMPRSGRAAGSWGGHATVEVGYTKTRNRNVTWGEEGTVTPAFEDAYLQAAWVVEAPAVIPPIR